MGKLTYLKDAIGIKMANVDINTNEELPHRTVYSRAIAYLGGLKAVAAYVPYDIEDIKKALLRGDKNLNTLHIDGWDRAVGFICRKGKAIKTPYGGLLDLCAKYKVSISPAEGVCILKEAAKQLAELPYDEANSTIRSARPAPMPIYKDW